jgi:hypothetical protein
MINIIDHKSLFVKYFSDYKSKLKKDRTRRSFIATEGRKCDLETQKWEELQVKTPPAIFIQPGAIRLVALNSIIYFPLLPGTHWAKILARRSKWAFSPMTQSSLPVVQADFHWNQIVSSHPPCWLQQWT